MSQDNHTPSTTGSSVPPTAIKDDDDASGDRKERDLNLLEGLKRLLLPFLYYNLASREGIQGYVNVVAEPPVEGLVSWIPFIMVMVLHNTHPLIGLWAAYGVMTVAVMLPKYYHSTYKPIYAGVYWLDAGFFLCYLAQGIVYSIKPYNDAMISPITNSSLVVSTLASIAFKIPFTSQMARVKMPDDWVRHSFFLPFNYFLTSIWLAVFVIICTSAWIPWALGWKSGWGYIILNTFVPISVPLVGMKATPPLAKWYIIKYGPPMMKTAAAPPTDKNEAPEDLAVVESSPDPDKKVESQANNVDPEKAELRDDEAYL